MAITFKDKLLTEYPIPRSISIWTSNGMQLEAVESLDDLIETCVEELASDILITDYKKAYGLVTHMPEGTVTVQSAMLNNNYLFQGNRLVKVTYDKGNNVAYLRYYPAMLTFKRKMLVVDLDNLQGDQLRYTKAYILWKMAEKELSILKSVNMQVDNGQVDWSVLESFRDKMHDTYENLKDSILIYASAN